MTSDASLSPEVEASARSARRKRELLLAGGSLLAGIVVLPALIYLVGTLLLGAYGGGPHLGSFYGDFFRNLAGGAVRTWFLVLSPYLFLTLIRFIFKFKGQQADVEIDSDEEPPPNSRDAARQTRRDPFVSP